MANQNSVQDDNQHNALIAHTGTAGTAETIRVVASPTFGYLVPADDVSGAVITTTFEHHEIHEGDHYFLNGFFTQDTAGFEDFRVTTPNTTTWLHMVWKYEATKQAQLYIYEGADDDGDGTALTPVNNNRNSAGTSVALIQQNPTVGTTGTLLESFNVGQGATPASFFGGNVDRTEELILKQNTKYLFRFQSLAGTNIISYQARWYEHVSKA